MKTLLVVATWVFLVTALSVVGRRLMPTDTEYVVEGRAEVRGEYPSLFIQQFAYVLPGYSPFQRIPPPTITDSAGTQFTVRIVQMRGVYRGYRQPTFEGPREVPTP